MNLDEYFQRIGFKGPFVKADLQTLNNVHWQHVHSIPFENLSIHCGERITMDLHNTYNKIVRKNRGGWCCENNFLFSWVLKEMGYTYTVLGARVFNNPLNKKTHYINKVDIDGTSYLADVSYGMYSQIWRPLELVLNKEQRQESGVYRLLEEDRMWVLEQTLRKPVVPNKQFATFDLVNKSEMIKVYGFNLTPCSVDLFEKNVCFLQTYPDSLFLLKSMCSLQTLTGFRALIGWTYSEVTFNYEEGADLFEIENVPDEEIEVVLKQKFNISLEKKLIPINNKPSYRK